MIRAGKIFRFPNVKTLFIRQAQTIAILAVAVAAFFCLGDALAASPKSGGTMRVGIPRDVAGLEPHVAHGASTYMVQQNVYDNLIGYAPPDGRLDPELAESWKIVDSTTYVFYLRKGVVFHDGSAFDAEDVKFSLERMMDPKSGATLAKQFKDIKSVTAIDSHTVEVKLSRPNAVFLALLASTTAHMVDKTWFEKGNDPTKKMNGTGPFKFVEFEPGLHTILEKNPNYWKRGMPYLDRIVIVPYNDDSARINALLSKEVQFIEYVPWTAFTQLEKNDKYSLFKGFTPFNILRLNVTQPPFDNVHVRQAMNYIIDREQLISLAFGGQGVPIKAGLIYPGTPFYSKELERWEYDPDKGLELLKKAGYNSFSDLSFTLKCATVTVHTDSAEAIQGLLTALGVKVKLEYIDIPTLLDYRKNGGYVALMDGLSLSYFDPDAYSYYFESGSIGHAKGSKFSDAELDALLAAGRVETDFDKRKQIYQAFEERLLQLSPWYFGFFRPQGEAMASHIKGYKRLPGDLGVRSTSRFEYLWNDK
jgi:peptide/nickel transport system substrate-binding protein